MEEKRDHARGSGFRKWYVPLSALTPREQARYFAMQVHPSDIHAVVAARRAIIDQRPSPPTTPGGVRRRV